MADETSWSGPWAEYYTAAQGKAPRETLTEVLSYFDKEPAPPEGEHRVAIDLGCGIGNDTFELLRRGWMVLAIDYQQEAIDYIIAHVTPEQDELLSTQVLYFEQITVIPDADLIYSSFSLPFCPPESFDRFWQAIVKAIKPGGRFAGQLFGNRDDAAKDSAMTTMPTDKALSLFAGFEIELFHEKEEDMPDATGTPHHWHVFSIIARKLSPSSG